MKSKFLLIITALTLIFGCKDEFDETSFKGNRSKTFQLDNVDNISFTVDNGLLISGPSDEKYTLIKTDENLKIEWTKNNYEWGNLIYGSGLVQSIYSFQINKVFQQNNGQYICFGTIQEGTDMVWSSTLIVILNQDGNQIQKLRFDDMYVSNVLRTNDEGFILFGYGMTIKLDKNFNVQWEKNFKNNKYSPIQIVSTSNNGFAITGTYNASHQVYLKTYDSDGNELLSKTYKHDERPSLESGNDIVQLPDNGFLIVGRAGRTLPQITDCQVIRTNEIGDTIWTKRFAYSNYSWFDKIINRESEFFVVEGTIGHPNENQESVLMKINTNGEVQDSLTIDKFEILVHSPLNNYIKVTKEDSNHIKLSMIDADNLFKKE
ncbi:MAG: hypothetical protein ACQERU_08880 [Bacteroidota bacterium]